MKVSVIMPTYNAGNYISMAIKSVLTQTYENLELIIVDDGSIDNTECMVAKFVDLRIKYFKIPHCGRRAQVRNYGIENSNGELIAFLDSDDAWLKEKLERQLPHLQENGIVGVASNAIFIAETPYYRQKNLGKSPKGYIDYTYEDILISNPVITSSVVVTRKLFLQSGFFDVNLIFQQDYDQWLRMSMYGLFRVINKPLTYYRVGDRSTRSPMELFETRLKILQKQIDLGYVNSHDISEAKSMAYLFMGRQFLGENRAESKKYYLLSCTTTSNLQRKFKSAFGFMISCLPCGLQKKLLLLLYKAEQIIFGCRNRKQKSIKNFQNQVYEDKIV